MNKEKFKHLPFNLFFSFIWGLPLYAILITTFDKDFLNITLVAIIYYIREAFVGMHYDYSIEKLEEKIIEKK